jgi:hypothetical protein
VNVQRKMQGVPCNVGVRPLMYVMIAARTNIHLR